MLNLRTSPAQAISQMLRQRYLVKPSSVHSKTTLSLILKVWLHDHSSGIIDVLGAESLLGRLLVQRGRVVHALCGTLPPAEAAVSLALWMESTDIVPVALSGDEIALACAAVDGEVIQFQTPLESDPMTWTLVENLCRTNFDGVMALERGRSLGVWRFSKGQMGGSEAFPASTTGSRLTLVRWVERDLPPLGLGRFSAALQSAMPGGPAENTTRVWKVFEQGLHEQLDARADRLIARLRQTYGHLQGEQLLATLGEELERATGVSDLVARVFRPS